MPWRRPRRFLSRREVADLRVGIALLAIGVLMAMCSYA